MEHPNQSQPNPGPGLGNPVDLQEIESKIVECLFNVSSSKKVSGGISVMAEDVEEAMAASRGPRVSGVCYLLIYSPSISIQ